jgi:hypothetical protein
MHPAPPPVTDTTRIALADPTAFVRTLIARLPLAQAVLTLCNYVLQPAFLNDLFDRYRGRCYEDVLTFPTLVQLLGDALMKHGTIRPALLQAQRDQQLLVSGEAFYGKLRRLPVPLSLGLLSEATARLRELLPEQTSPLPACLAAFDVQVIDGKKSKNVAKRLAATRGQPGKVFGAKLLVCMQPATRLLHTIAADRDGESNDNPLVPALLQALPPAAQPRLFVNDAQFCDLVQMRRYGAGGAHFLLRYHPKVHFHPDPQRPAREWTDPQGRRLREEWGWLGAVKDKRRCYVRRITWFRTDHKDLCVVTDLLDGAAYPAEDLLAVYLIRWRIETVFGEVVTVFGLKHLIGSTPEASAFETAFCMLIYNMIVVVKAYVAAEQQLSIDDVSSAMLFKSVREEMISLNKLAQPSQVAACLPAAQGAAATREALRELLRGRWERGWKKARNKKRRVYGPKPKRSGAHTSIYRLQQQHKENQKKRSPAKGP